MSDNAQKENQAEPEIEVGGLHPDPNEAPVTPLGHRGGRYFLLTAEGELREMTARDLEGGRGVYDLFVGGQHNGFPVEMWLATHFPPKRRREDPNAENRSDEDKFEWSRALAGEWIMRACVAAGIYDEDTPVKGLGVWRDGQRQDGDTGAILHCGRWLIVREGSEYRVEPAGARRRGSVYPTGPRGGFPDDPKATLAEAPPSAPELVAFMDRVRRSWGWKRPADVEAWFGWLAVASLGAYPEWRPHLWVNGRRGSGKSELSQLANLLLGPISPGVYNDFSAAGIRQKTNGQARPHLFDEAERDGAAGRLEAVIEMFRGMSGDSGAAAVRGRSDHTAVTFSLFGAGYLASIIPGRLEPQDRSRFVMVELNPLPKTDKPAEAALALEKLRRDATAIGRRLWLRMLARSIDYDRTFRMCRDLVQRLGGDARDGATIGAILAGGHLLFCDEPIDEGHLEDMAAIAQPLIDDARAATEDGEGELCWRRLMQSMVNFGGGEVRTIGDILRWSLRGGDDSETSMRKLGRVGLRYRPANPSKGAPAALFIVSGVHRQLDQIFAGSRWADGGHRQALLMLDGVAPARDPVRISGSKLRALSIPEDYWPSVKEDDDD